jgi:hypothetical protein
MLIDVVVPPPTLIEADVILPQGPPGPAGADGAPGPPGPSGADVPHHVNHDTGGSDAIAALSAGVLTSGTVNDARLSANIPRLDINNQFGTTGRLSFGPAPSVTGEINFSKGNWLAAKDTTGTDRYLIQIEESNNRVFIDGSGLGTLFGSAIQATGLGTTPLNADSLTTGTVPNARFNANVAVTTSVSIGTNPATVGAIRLANNQSIRARNAANSADLAMLTVDNTNVLTIGSSGIPSTTVATNMAPFPDAAKDLGSSAFRWRDLFASRAISLAELPFANLPAGPPVGTLANISDSTIATIGGTIAGGGTNHVLGRYNGTVWKVVA